MPRAAPAVAARSGVEIMACVSMMLITGANKGLGRETARRLVAEGHDLWAAARNPERGRAAAEELGARPLVLDVTDDASVDKCREHSRSRNRADGHDWPRGPDGLLHKPRRSRALVEPRRLVGRVRAHLGVPDTF